MCIIIYLSYVNVSCSVVILLFYLKSLGFSKKDLDFEVYGVWTISIIVNLGKQRLQENEVKF